MIYFSQYDLFKNTFLKKELEEWEKIELIDKNSIEKIRTHYELNKNENVKFPFFILVYIFFGLSLITLFATKWNEISNLIKTIYLISLTFITYILSLYHFKKNEKYLSNGLLFFANIFLCSSLIIISQIYKFNINTVDILLFSTFIIAFTTLIVKSQILSIELIGIATFWLFLYYSKFHNISFWYILFLIIAFFKFEKASKNDLYVILTFVICGLFYWLFLYGKAANDDYIAFYCASFILLILAIFINSETLFIIAALTISLIMLLDFRYRIIIDSDFNRIYFCYFLFLFLSIFALLKQKNEAIIFILIFIFFEFLAILNYNSNRNLVDKFYFNKCIFLYSFFTVLIIFQLSFYVAKISKFYANSLKISSLIYGAIILWFLFFVKNYDVKFMNTNLTFLIIFSIPLIFNAVKKQHFLNLSTLLLFLIWHFGFFDFVRLKISIENYNILMNIILFIIAIIFALYLILNEYKKSGILLIVISILIKYFSMKYNQISLSITFLILGIIVFVISKKIKVQNENK